MSEQEYHDVMREHPARESERLAADVGVDVEKMDEMLGVDRKDFPR